MNLLPVAHRELLVLSRRPLLYWLRSGTGLAIAALSTGLVTVYLLDGAAPAELGAPLFQALAAVSFVLCLFAGPCLLADSLAEEKRAGTLGLLFLTDLRGHDIVAGKCVALAMPAVHCLLAVLPVMAVAFFLGGVSGGEFLRMSAALVNLLFCSLALTVLCSALARDGRRAFGASLLMILGVGAALPSFTHWLGETGNATALVLNSLSSPGMPFWAVLDADNAADPDAFLHPLILSHTAAWLGLVVASVALPFAWQERPERLTRFTRARSHQPAPRHTALQPLVWLARRQLGGPAASWLMAGGIALTILLLLRLAGGPAFGGLHVVLVAYALHAIFKVSVASAASRAFLRERDSGALEILFVTPLGERSVWRAWLAGLRRRFLLPALALVAFDLALAWHWFVMVPSDPAGVGQFVLVLLASVMFLLDCYALSWVGLWQGLTAPNATRASIRTLLFVLVLPGAVFVALLGLLATSAGPLEDALVALGIGWFFTGFLTDIGIGAWSMVRLSHDGREAALARGR